MSDILSEKVSSDASSDATTLSQRFQDQLEAILKKLRKDPSTITAEEARILSENVATRDDRAKGSSQAQASHRSLLMAAKDLHIAVDGSPDEATTEVLRVAQSIVSKLQKAVGHTNAPHPEVEAELQEEIAKIEPKIAQGTVTKAEADHLHSLEARAHGHTEKGGIAAVAQSVAARRERQLSLSSSTGSILSPVNGRSRANSRNFTSPQQRSRQEKEDDSHNAEMTMRPKIEAGFAAASGMDDPQTLDARANRGTEEHVCLGLCESHASNGSARASDERPRASSESINSRDTLSGSKHHGDLQDGNSAVSPKGENGFSTQLNPKTVQPQEMPTNSHTEKSGLSPTAQSFVSRRQESLSDVSNSSATKHRKEHSQPDKDLNKVDEELENNEQDMHVKRLVQDGHGRVDENGKLLAEPSYDADDR
ncbi:uncharacterized protein J4E87_002654 [Alternaria ethzedia]|uniref:uncharacterized protein n=2 Tax=Alternaria sect. Infectoriae TaxID=2499258 RepID=UPI0020C3CAD1|nr:uncharacterized protein J4E87_002654 [Alternaria ethzedia]KAI4631947.1 hypothetical protein J4E87_002654 [Alternaria ethzedia]